MNLHHCETKILYFISCCRSTKAKSCTDLIKGTGAEEWHASVQACLQETCSSDDLSTAAQWLSRMIFQHKNGAHIWSESYYLEKYSVSCIKIFQGTSEKGKLEKRNTIIMFSFLDPLLYSDLMQLFRNISITETKKYIIKLKCYRKIHKIQGQSHLLLAQVHFFHLPDLCDMLQLV